MFFEKYLICFAALSVIKVTGSPLHALADDAVNCSVAESKLELFTSFKLFF